MSVVNFNVYDLLVDKLGENIAFEVCEKLGGMDLTIPTKAHKTYRIRALVNKHKEILKDRNKRNKFVNIFSKEMDISKSVIYKILKDCEDD